MASVSMHKSGGSLTQSSLLLTGKNVNPGYVSQIINLTQTTSASYLLLSSLDISRRNLALNGKEIFKKVTDMAQYARDEINAIGDYYAYSREIVNGDSVFDFDVTKLSIHTLDIGLAGIEVYDILRDEYDIQVEFGDLGNILAYVSVGDRVRDLERLGQRLAGDPPPLQAGPGRDAQPGIYQPSGGRHPPGGFLCGKGIFAAERKRGPGMQ